MVAELTESFERHLVPDTPDDGERSNQKDATAEQFTSALDGVTRQNSELQAELAQTASSKQTYTQAGSTSSKARVTDYGTRRGHTAAGKAR